jgi:hypothetical protein
MHGSEWLTSTHAPTMLPLASPHDQTLGNHEFDFGTAMLASFIGNLSFPMLGGCNTDTSAEPSLRGKLQKFTVLTHRPFKVRSVAGGGGSKRGWQIAVQSLTALKQNHCHLRPTRLALWAGSRPPPA